MTVVTICDDHDSEIVTLQPIEISMKFDGVTVVTIFYSSYLRKEKRKREEG